MIGPIARILARYIAGALVAASMIDAGFGREIATDADFVLIIQTALAAIAMMVVEAWYWLAKRKGWTT